MAETTPPPPSPVAFISYHRKTDSDFAKALQTEAHRFSKPWYARRKIHLLRDDSDLDASPELWSQISALLDSSSHLILLASPGAARSKWVTKEISHWLSVASPDRLIIILTEGAIEWNDTKGDFDWTKTTSLPPELKGIFDLGLNYQDLRELKENLGARKRDPRMQNCVAGIVSTLTGVNKSDLIGQDIKNRRRAIALAWSGSVTLAAISIVTVVMAYMLLLQSRDLRTERDAAEAARAEAVGERKIAEKERQNALSQSIANEALLSLETSLDRAALLSAQAYMVSPTPKSRQALHKVLQHAPLAIRLYHHSSPISDVSISNDGKLILLGGEDGVISAWSADTGDFQYDLSRGAPPVQSMDLDASDGLLAVGRTDGSVQIWSLEHRRKVLQHQEHQTPVLSVSFDPSSRIVASSGEDSTIVLWDLERRRVSHRLAEQNVDTIYTVEFGDNGDKLVSASRQGQVLVWSATDGRLLSRHQDAHHKITVTPFMNDLVAIAEDGSTIVVAEELDGIHTTPDGRARLRKWDINEVHEGYSAHIHSAMSFFLFLGGGDGDFVINGVSKAELSAIAPRGLLPLAVSTTGHAVSSTRDHRNRLQLWRDYRHHSDRFITLDGHEERVIALDFDASGERFVSGDISGHAILWNIYGQTPRAPKFIPYPDIGNLNHDSFAAGSFFQHGPGGVRVSPPTAEDEIAQDVENRPTVSFTTGRPLDCAALSPNGAHVLTYAEEGVFSVHDATDGAHRFSSPNRIDHDRVEKCAVDNQGRFAALLIESGEMQGQLLFHDLDSGNFWYDISGTETRDLKAGDSGVFASVDEGGGFVSWRVSPDGLERHTPLTNQSQPIRDVVIQSLSDWHLPHYRLVTIGDEGICDWYAVSEYLLPICRPELRIVEGWRLAVEGNLIAILEHPKRGLMTQYEGTSVSLWSRDDGQMIGRLSGRPTDYPAVPEDLAFDRDGGSIVIVWSRGVEMRTIDEDQLIEHACDIGNRVLRDDEIQNLLGGHRGAVACM